MAWKQFFFSSLHNESLNYLNNHADFVHWTNETLFNLQIL